MHIVNMMRALQLWKKEEEPHELCTKWGAEIKNDRNHDKIILPEYPRPQLQRRQYEILNGVWKYAINQEKKLPSHWDGEILVPFSPESELSGVKRQLQPDEYLWYERSVDVVLEGHEKDHLLLHFGAVDERCRVFVNGRKAGDHAGGYQSFTCDITELVQDGQNRIQVWDKDVSDTSYHGRGKQRIRRGGMFYTAQSGIWQTVWMEWVPENYISRLKIEPLYDQSQVKIECEMLFFETQRKEAVMPSGKFTVEADHGIVSMGYGKLVKRQILQKRNAFDLDGIPAMIEKRKYIVLLDIPDKKSWSPESPFLYDLFISIGKDKVKSYFGMRLFSIERNKDGQNMMCLNHQPYFQNGILDQGYWPESLMTPCSDAAMIYDIKKMKELGFNMLRKHCKVEPMRWYYHCDRLGMIVWQDMINGGRTYNLVMSCYIPTCFPKLRYSSDHFFPSRKDRKGRAEWKRDCVHTVRQLYNCTCICTWVLFNEGWGQFDAKENTDMVRQLDHTRPIDSASGWFDQRSGDIKSIHVYFFDIRMETHNRAFALSEYGGYALMIHNHSYSENVFGYQNYQNSKTFQRDYHKLMSKVDYLRQSGMSAAVYTQLSDVEEEVNGLLTYDRKICKLD